MKLLSFSLAMLIASTPLLADDGERLVRSVSSPPGVTEDPEPEGEHAFIKFLNFHVPAQLANGELTTIVYNDIDGNWVKDELKAKPLINVYVYGPVIGFDNHEASGFAGHGRRDAFGAVSLDDGETWKVTNLSNSADQSSFEVSTPFPDPGLPHDGIDITTECEGDFCLTEATAIDVRSPNTRLEIEGFSPFAAQQIDIQNGATGDHVTFIRSKRDGTFETTQKRFVPDDEVPCTIKAVVGDDESNIIAVADAPEDCVGVADNLITDYPGDAINVFHGVAGNKVIVAWPSRFCSAGNPVWSTEFPTEEVADYLGIDIEADFYLTDLFGAAGSQSSTNYDELGHAPVGEVPYSCLWSARGVLREDPENADHTEVVWFQAERLTSGARDVNRVETSCVAGAGCAITWQEDPEGTRPGEGEGPGTGWSGATAASKTDIWYSFIEWEDFDIVDNNGTIEPLADNIMDSGRPTPYVPMMAAARLTNNDRCTFPIIPTDVSYCNDEIAGAYSIKDQCVGFVEIPLGPQGNMTPICVVDSNGDGTMNAGDLPNLANTAATRPRLNLQPRDSDGDGVVDDAWVVVVSEEDKGLGRFGFLTDEEWTLNDLNDIGTTCDPEAGIENCQKADVGKDVFWASFNLGSPATSEGVDVDYSLVSNVLAQGAQLNQPEVNWRTGVYYPPMDTETMWDFGDLNFLIFNTEIARRTSMMSQPAGKATDGGTQDGLVAMPLWKQGIVNQGGPADISTRRIVAPAEVDETTENPYAASNMVCAWYDGEGLEQPGVMYFTDGSNPYYPHGLCMAAPINLSARTPYECEATTGTSGTADGVCPGDPAITECVDDTMFGQLCSAVDDPENSQTYDKVLSWYECPGWNGANVSNDAVVEPDACGGGDPINGVIGTNMDDQSWYNPLEVSKAHRGFLDGNHIMMIYAWSPNFKLNTVGHDRYELYTRRSFDSGVTWKTTPASFTASNDVVYSVGNGTTTCETMRDGADSTLDTHLCTAYEADVPEQSRNVSQLKSMANTILDPRYTAAGGIPPKGVPTEGDLEWAIYEPIEPTDILEPSRNFVVYEDGDNTTVAVGEAEPLNLAYGRAEFFGDHFTVWTELDTGFSTIDDCYPNNAHDDPDVDWAVGTGFCNEFDTLEGFQDALSEEASITASAYGDFLYAVWGQFNVDLDNDNEFIDGDSMFRRVWYLDDYISTDNSYTLPGTQQ